jgi:N-acyl-D-aspartate/D-glutamate deacylase
VPSLGYQAPFIEKAKAIHETRKAAGLDIWTSWHHVAPTVMINFVNSLSFAQSNNYVWNDIIDAQTEDAKLALLTDPAWLDRARASWDRINQLSRAKNPETYVLFESETGSGPTGITLAEYMTQAGIDHPSDALAKWVVDNGILSVLRLKDIPNSEEAIDYLLHDPKAVGNVADSGAHGKMFCGIGDNVLLLTRYVRDSDRLTIEQGVRQLTGNIADHFQMTDRGTLEVGKRADVVVFNLDEIDRRPEFKTYDVPDGEGGRTYRYSRPPAPVRLTLVNGVTTFDNGSFTGNFPGEYISTGDTDEAHYAQAARRTA